MDYYKILGITRHASEEEIKRAFRTLAHKHHPDKGGDEKKFKEINEAYQVLSDKAKRAQYDRFGQVFEGGAARGGPFHNAQGPFGEIRFDFDGMNGDLGDIFDAFFEGMGVRQKRRTYHRGADLQVVEEITLEDAFRGVEKQVQYETFVRCDTCKGVGHEAHAGFETCSVCAGRGEIRETRQSFFGNFAQVKSCEKCFGAGQIPKKACGACRGSGRVRGRKTLTIHIRPGVEDGQIITVKGGGEAGERAAEDGDLYARIHVKPHSVFERRGDDLVVRKEVGLVQLMLGKKIAIPTISGGNAHIEVPPHTDIKELLRVPNEGMPRTRGFGRGNLLVQFQVKTPSRISAKAKKLLEELEKEME